jgi:hypothetical protein
MNDEPPYDETWWERELHRNEKLMDRYLAALADDPDLARPRRPDDAPGVLPPESPDPKDAGAAGNLDMFELEGLEEALLEAAAAGEETADGTADSVDPGFENTPSDNEGYAEVAQLARRFAVAVGSLELSRETPGILALSAPKIGANLAGGHGLGYDEETLCGNIVKCRWALADCEFCREMLEQLAQRTGRGIYRALAEESRRLSERIRERIARLRARVWW